MKSILPVLAAAALAFAAAFAASAADIRTDWLYHAAPGVDPARWKLHVDAEKKQAMLQLLP